MGKKKLSIKAFNANVEAFNTSWSSLDDAEIRQSTCNYKISIAMTGRPSPQRGRPISDAQKAQHSAFRKGKKHSAETLAKMSLAAKGRVVPENSKSRQPSPRKGMKVSEETRAKMCAAQQKRKPFSDETRAKIAAAATGRVLSAESRAKIASTRRENLSKINKD